MNWFKITRWMQKGDKSSFDIPVKDQRNFLRSLGTPKDIIDRSFKQYLCQNLFLPKSKVFFFNVVFGLIFPLALLYFFAKGFLLKKRDVIPAVIEDKKMEEVVPGILMQQYCPQSNCWVSGSALVLEDLCFLFKLMRRAPMSPYFVFKVLMNMAHYSALIHTHQPKVIIQFGEFSFSRTALTEFCHQYGIKHINVMHGEKLYFIRDSFFQYDECYVWSDYYIELMKSLGAEPNQFKVCLPPSMRIKTSHYKNQKCYADFKYYLALITEPELKIIVNSLHLLKQENKSIVFRPHPRYTDMNLLRKYVREDEIENWQKVSIMESLSNVSAAIGVYTTVLVQAYFSGINVILDDVSNPSQFAKLKEMKYLLIDKAESRLSFYLKTRY